MAKKQHQLDRERSRGHIEIGLCGRDMPRGNTWGYESCGTCARVARARDERKSPSQHATRKKPSQLDAEIAVKLVPHAAKGDRVLADLKSWGVDRAQVEEVRAAFRAGDHPRAMALARDLGWNRAAKRGRAFR